MRRPHCISVGSFNFTVVLDGDVREHRPVDEALREELLGEGVALLSSDLVGRFFQTGAVRARVERDERKVRRARAERDITDLFGLGLVERAGVGARVPECFFVVSRVGGVLSHLHAIAAIEFNTGPPPNHDLVEVAAGAADVGVLDLHGELDLPC